MLLKAAISQDLGYTSMLFGATVVLEGACHVELDDSGSLDSLAAMLLESRSQVAESKKQFLASEPDCRQAFELIKRLQEVAEEWQVPMWIAAVDLTKSVRQRDPQSTVVSTLGARC